MDHLPVEIYLGSEERNGKRARKNEKSKEYRFRWKLKKREEYEKKIEEKGEKKREIGVRGISERWERIIKNMWKVGKELKMVKEIKKEEWEE